MGSSLSTIRLSHDPSWGDTHVPNSQLSMLAALLFVELAWKLKLLIRNNLNVISLVNILWKVTQDVYPQFAEVP